MVDKSATPKILSGKTAKTVLGIFAKEPQPGRVKTRLCPPLSAVEAAGLYRVMLSETVARMGAGPFALVLFYTGDEAFFRSAFPGLALLPQAEGDLGFRMEQAFGQLFARGCSKAALIGSDSPDLPLERVEMAFAALTRQECVIIPAADGGYALIGQSRHRPELFTDIPWSTDGVLEATRGRTRELSLAYDELPAWEDVDDLPSLRRLLRRSPHCATARFARNRLRRHL